MADTPPAEYDEVAEAYGRALDRPGDDFADPLLTELTGDVAGRDVLSLACGHGRDTRMLARLGADVTGVDVSMEMLGHARRYEADDPRGITYVDGDAQELAGFEDGSFDGVLCHMALMDIPDLDAATLSVARVLGDGGWTTSSIIATRSASSGTGSRRTRTTVRSARTSTRSPTPAFASNASSRRIMRPTTPARSQGFSTRAP